MAARPRKTKDMKERSIHVRLTEEQHKLISKAAENAGGLQLSSWVRMIVVKAARETVEK